MLHVMAACTVQKAYCVFKTQPQWNPAPVALQDAIRVNATQFRYGWFWMHDWLLRVQKPSIAAKYFSPHIHLHITHSLRTWGLGSVKKHEDLHFIPQNTHKTWVQWREFVIPALGRQTRGSLAPAGQPVYPNWWETLYQKMKKILHTNLWCDVHTKPHTMHPPTHVCMYSHTHKPGSNHASCILSNWI